MTDITGSVGEGGTNKTHDVALVQAMLRIVKSKKGTPYLSGNYDGTYGQQTKNAIIAFQADYAATMQVVAQVREQLGHMHAEVNKLASTTQTRQKLNITQVREQLAYKPRKEDESILQSITQTRQKLGYSPLVGEKPLVSATTLTRDKLIKPLLTAPTLSREKLGYIEKGGPTIAALAAALPASYKPLRIIPGTKTVYLEGSATDANQARRDHVRRSQDRPQGHADRLAAHLRGPGEGDSDQCRARGEQPQLRPRVRHRVQGLQVDPR
jgi:hypothetical protein